MKKNNAIIVLSIFKLSVLFFIFCHRNIFCMDTSQVGQTTIHIIQEDITQLSGIDAIVNAAKDRT